MTAITQLTDADTDLLMEALMQPGTEVCWMTNWYHAGFAPRDLNRLHDWTRVPFLLPHASQGSYEDYQQCIWEINIKEWLAQNGMLWGEDWEGTIASIKHKDKRWDTRITFYFRPGLEDKAMLFKLRWK